MVLPWPYFRATGTGVLGGKSTTSRGVRWDGAAISLVSSEVSRPFGPVTTRPIVREASSASSRHCARSSATLFEQRVRRRAWPLEVCTTRNWVDTRRDSHVISGDLQLRSRQGFGLWRDPRRQLQRFKFGGARFAAVQRAVGAVRDRDEVVGTERLAASIAVELIAAGTEHGAASRAEVHFQEGIAAVFVVFDRKTFKERVAGGAGGGVELLSHEIIISVKAALVKHLMNRIENILVQRWCKL